jgi:EpsI family protein
MTKPGRVVLCVIIMSGGLAALAGFERLGRTERPALRRALVSLPFQLGDWIGRDEPLDSDIVDRAQTTEYLNRVYDSRKQPGLSVRLWVNYSREGTNLRHTPEICLPSVGWTKIESQTRVLAVPLLHDGRLTLTRLAYNRDDVVEHVGFWYYIFGEGRLERYVRRLPITSRSSHGRTTRGSSMTVEVFYPGDRDPDGEAVCDFAQELVQALAPILPLECAIYHVP